jgi:UDP-glucose 4-epimerase
VKILVTGGAGFIGSHIADRLVADGHSVIVVDNLSRGHREFVPETAAFHQLDIRDAAVRELIVREKPAVICHLAAQIDVRQSVADPVADASVNILGTLNVVEGAREAGTRRVIFSSTGGAIYGEAEVVPTPETYPARPLSPYGSAKLSSEVYLDYYQQVYGLSYAALRFANVYGPRQDPHGEAGVVAIFAERMLRGEQPIIHGDGLNTRDYVYVGDVVSAAAHLIDKDVSGAFNVGTGKETTVNEIFRRLRDLTGAAVEEVHGPAKVGEQRRSALDCARLRSLGWSPSVDLEEGLRRTVAYFGERVAT